MNENILDSLGEPDLDLPETAEFYRIRLWINKGVKRVDVNKHILLSSHEMNEELDRLSKKNPLWANLLAEFFLLDK